MNNTNFYSTKLIDLGSCCFRQPFAESHCRFLHGYRLQAKLYFMSNKLDKNNWVMDFGGLKNLKKDLRETFDHTTVISEKDPKINLFKNLVKEEVIQLVILPEISIEMFAKYCLEKANEMIDKRVLCYRVEVYEHERNCGIYELKN